MSDASKKDSKKGIISMRLVDGPIPQRTRLGRKTMYRFWQIKEGQNGIFSGGDINKMNAALYQYKRKYGGEFACRTLDNGDILVHCYKGANKKHPMQIEEEWLEQQNAKTDKPDDSKE
jgi:hypothetical protein